VIGKLVNPPDGNRVTDPKRTVVTCRINSLPCIAGHSSFTASRNARSKNCSK
jgi:hypothetical protein